MESLVDDAVMLLEYLIKKDITVTFHGNRLNLSNITHLIVSEINEQEASLLARHCKQLKNLSCTFIDLI